MKFFSFIIQSRSFKSRQTDRQTNIISTDYFESIFQKKQFMKNGSFTNFWFVGSRIGVICES